MSPNDPPISSSSKEIIPAEHDIDIPIDDETELSVDGSPAKKKQKSSNSPEPQPSSKISENQKWETLGTGASTSTAAQGEPSGSLAIGAAVQVAEHGEQATNVVADQLQEQAVDLFAELGFLIPALQGFSAVDNVQEALQIPNMPFVLLPPILKALIGAGEAVFFTKKSLTPSDMNPQRHRLLIHTGRVDLSYFFSQQDITNLNTGAGSIEISVVVAGTAYDVTMRIRQMGASRYLALMQGWATVLENSNFEAGQKIAIYAFKDHNNVNVFYILPIHPPPA